MRNSTLVLVSWVALAFAKDLCEVFTVTSTGAYVWHPTESPEAEGLWSKPIVSTDGSHSTSDPEVPSTYGSNDYHGSEYRARVCRLKRLKDLNGAIQRLKATG
jgi:hypothetical protein